VRTGVTAVLPHSGNLYREKVPGAIFVGNGFGKLAGYTQVEELLRRVWRIRVTFSSSPHHATFSITF
jgi:L-aminopeptidase/D-esterase-like protein